MELREVAWQDGYSAITKLEVISAEEKVIDRLYFGLMNILTRGHYAVRPPRLELERLEQVLLDQVLSALPDAGRAILERQMATLNLVQRDGHYQKTVFYCINRGEDRFTDDLRFPRRVEDARFASLTFEVPGQSKLFHASFWVHDGRIFQITFDRSVRDVLTAPDIRIGKVQVTPEVILTSS